MSHWAPNITHWVFNADGSLTINWEVDSFFEDSDPPDDVVVLLDGAVFKDLGMAGRNIDIPTDTLKGFAGNVLVVAVSFKWTGPPDDVKQSPVLVPIPAAPGPSTSTDPPTPVIKLVDRQPQTLQHPNQITIAWSSNSYNDGDIIWGTSAQPARFSHSIKPVSAMYKGQWTTDKPLPQATLHSFQVRVKNSLKGNVWISATLEIKSVRNFTSVRGFLLASGVAGPSFSLPQAIGHRGSLRDVMGI